MSVPTEWNETNIQKALIMSTGTDEQQEQSRAFFKEHLFPTSVVPEAVANGSLPVVPLTTVDDYKALLSLVADDVIWIYKASNQDVDDGSDFKDHHLRHAIDNGDTFYHACSDSTEFHISDVPVLKELLSKFGHTGLIAWSALERDQTPLNELLTDKYYEAYEYAKQFFPDQGRYILLADASQRDRLQVELASVGYSCKCFDKKLDLWLYDASLTHDQFHAICRFAKCVYRYDGDYKIRECKFRYFNSYSVVTTNRIVASYLGFQYSLKGGRSYRPYDPA